MEPDWTRTNPALSLQPNAYYSMHLAAGVGPPESRTAHSQAHQGISRFDSGHVDNIHDVNIILKDDDASYGNTPFGGNRSCSNSHLGNLNDDNFYGHNSYGGNIINNDNPNVGYPNVDNLNVNGIYHNPYDSNINFDGTSYANTPYSANPNFDNIRGDNPYHGTMICADNPNAVNPILNYPNVGYPNVRNPNVDYTNVGNPIAGNPNVSYSIAGNPSNNVQFTSSIPDKNRLLCLHEGCFKDFGRLFELERHWKTHQFPEFECPFAGCRRKGAEGFSRKDNRDKHMKNCKSQPKS
ncbi:hypothetical protein MMC22_000500 [Lobaria immixta]|nr:hypothetical protein [Lobaria immixta]